MRSRTKLLQKLDLIWHLLVLGNSLYESKHQLESSSFAILHAMSAIAILSNSISLATILQV